MRSQRHRVGQSFLGILIFSLVLAQAQPSDTELPDKNTYGFMVYNWDAPLEDAFPAIFSLGARWIHAEGPNQLSKSIHWGQVQPRGDDPGYYDFETVSWIQDAASQGFDVLLTLSTGHDSPNWWFRNTYSPWVECHEELVSCAGGFQAVGFASNCPPADEHWQQWYDFVYRTVDHFDGSEAIRPEVTYFQSINEAHLRCGPFHGGYWVGTIEDMYGGGAQGPVDIDIDPDPGQPEIEALDRGVVPVAYRAVQKASDSRVARGRPGALFVQGAPSGFYQFLELYQSYKAEEDEPDGISPAEQRQIIELAMEYGLYPQVSCDGLSVRCNAENYIECTPECFNEIAAWMQNDYMDYNCELMNYSLDYSTSYDVYAMRTVDAYGLNLWAEVFSGPTGSAKAMSYMRERLDPGKRLWVTDAHLAANPRPAPEIEAYRAYHLLETLTGAYKAGVEWIAPTYLTGEGIGLYTTGLAEQLEAADTFSMMAGLFPTARSFAFLDEAVEGDVVLYEFQLHDDDPGTDRHAMVGWCLDEEPWDPGTFVNPECSNATPQLVDLSPYIGDLTNGSVTAHDYKGIVLSQVSCDGQPCCTAQSPCVLHIGEAPVVITWISNDGCGDPTATLEGISVQNSPLYLTSSAPAEQLTVLGHYDNGVDCDVSAGSLGTTYQSQDPDIASVDSDGLAVAQSMGSTIVDVANDGWTDEALVVVESLPMQLMASDSQFEWPAYSGAVGYDIVRGDLTALRTSQGDFSTSTELCLGDDIGATTISDTHEPLPGAGCWYLMRVVYSSSGNTGSYDVDGTGTTRNDGVAASPHACP